MSQGTFNSALEQGLAFGLTLARAKQAAAQQAIAQELARQRLDETSRYHDQQTKQHDAAQQSTDAYRGSLLRLRGDSNDMSAERLYRQQDQDQRKQADQQQTQGANADFIMRGSGAPEAAGASYMGGDHSDESFYRTAEGLQAQRGAIAGLPPQAQKPLIEDATHRMGAQMADERWAQRTQILAQRKLDNAHLLFDQLPKNLQTPEMKAHLIGQAMGGFSVSASQAKGLEPLRQAELAHKGWIEARAQHIDALRSVNEYRKQHSQELRPPTDSKGNPAPATDPAWAPYNLAQKGLRPLIEQAGQSKRARDEALKASHDAKDRALGIGQPEQQQGPQGSQGGPTQQVTPNPADVEKHRAGASAAMQQIDRQIPQGTPITPELLQQIREQMRQSLGGQGAAPDEGSPYDDQRTEPDGMDGDGMDEEEAALEAELAGAGT